MSSNMRLHLHSYNTQLQPATHNFSNDSSQATYDDSTTFDESSNIGNPDQFYDKTTTSESEFGHPDDYDDDDDRYLYTQLHCRVPRRALSLKRGYPPKSSGGVGGGYHASTFIDRSSDDSSDNSSDDDVPRTCNPGLTMLGEEISPIREENSQNVPPCPPMLIQQIPGFRPSYTSTKSKLPRTNPMHVANTPRGGILMSRNPRQRPQSLYSSMGRSDNNRHSSSLECNPKRAEVYGVPQQVARQKGLIGMVNLSIEMNCERVKVMVGEADYFFDRSSPQVLSKIEIGLKSIRDNRSSSRLSQSSSTMVKNTNQPRFNETLRIRISDRNFKEHDRLSVRCYVQQQLGASNDKSWTLLGCMAFSLRKLEAKRLSGEREGYFLLKSDRGEQTHFAVKNIKHTTFYGGLSNDISVGTTVSSSISTRSCSPVKMIMNENDWPRHHHQGGGGHHRLGPHPHHQGNGQVPTHLPFATSAAAAAVAAHQNPLCASSAPVFTAPMYNHYHPRQQPQQQHHHRQNIVPAALSAAGVVHGLLSAPPTTLLRHLGRGGRGGEGGGDRCQLDSETSGSSNNSLDEPGRGYHQGHRYTLPSISTTSDSCSEYSVEVSDPLRHIDMQLLYASSPTDNLEEPSTSHGLDTKDHQTVRRVASFTYSPQGTSDKHNKRQVDEKKAKPSITKKISSFFSKELTSSTSQLHPSQDEIRSWSQSLENLLKHKAGLFHLKQFMESQVCAENIDFWKECEEYKKMKEGKKAQQKAHQIFSEYVSENAVKQVNLEAEVRKATQASLESGPKPDTFSLAQTRIELLMSQGPYTAFLQSPLYQNLIKSTSSDDAKSSHSS